jgi:hypothetical protein
MKIKQGLLPVISLLFSLSYIHAQDQKPNFSGTWTLDKEKSDLGPRNPESGRRPGGDLKEGEGGKQPREGANDGRVGRPRGGMFDSMIEAQ